MTRANPGAQRPPAVELREVADRDLSVFFEHQRDPVARHMVAFGAKDPDDRAAFDEKWERVRNDPAIFTRTILCDGRVAGYITSFERYGLPEIGYWIGRDLWGRGVATRALAAALELVSVRPLYARVAKDNAASLRVLIKCGFVICGENREFGHARGAEVEEFVMKLEGGGRTAAGAAATAELREAP
jgi:RimJ/RimL family protein N-acetyltransferase